MGIFVGAACGATGQEAEREVVAPEEHRSTKITDMARRKHVSIPGLTGALSTAIGRELSSPPDLVGALGGYAESCGAGEIAGCYMLGTLDRPRTVRDEQKLAVALEPLSAACAAGVPAGCHLVGLTLDDEGPQPVEPKAAHAAYRKACDLDFQPSCVRLAPYYLFGPQAKEAGSKAQHDALRAAACKAGFPSGCRAPARSRAGGDDARACALGDLHACLSEKGGRRGAAARKTLEALYEALRAICENARHPGACEDLQRHFTP